MTKPAKNFRLLIVGDLIMWIEEEEQQPVQEQPSHTSQSDTSGLRALFFLLAFAVLAFLLLRL
jgi:hypothetical protein